MKNLNIKNVVPFEKSKRDDDSIVIDHGIRTLEAVLDVSDYIKDLPLSTQHNDTLVSLFKSLLLTAEHESFMQGFTACMDKIQGCGLKAAMDMKVKITDIDM